LQVAVVSNGQALGALISRHGSPHVVVREWPVAHGESSVLSGVLDRWSGLSRDLIERFIDVVSLECRLSRGARRGHRADLVTLDRWMQRKRGRTLVGARSSDLRVYLDERREAGIDDRLYRRLISSTQLFYAYLCDSGCRADNAARCIPGAVD
jgi:hypothetical protein